MENKVLGHRGYIGSRPYFCGDYPQHVQNLIIRNHCQKHRLTYLLSATEYMMENCYMMLEEVLRNISALDGIVLFSIFMLPDSSSERQKIYKRIIDAKRSLHAALEDIVIENNDNIQMVEDILSLNKIAKSKMSMSKMEDFLLI